MESTKRKEESSSWLARGKASRSREKSKGASEELAAPGFVEEGRLDGLALEEEKERVKSAIRPSLSEREKGAKGTWRGRVVVVDSGGPQPSGLNGTAPTSKTPTIVNGSLDLGCSRRVRETDR